MINRVLLYYPYGPLFQRGEDRSQGDIAGSCATSLRAANDLGYMCAALKKTGIDVMIRDYMGERKNKKDFLSDLKTFKPDLIVCSITTATILSDLDTFRLAKAVNPDIVTVAKGAYFYCTDFNTENYGIFQPMDYALAGESETIIDKLVLALNRAQDISSLKGVVWRGENSYVSNGPADFVENLDSISFPERAAMNNNLYTSPDTGEPMATIQTDRGCPFECTYCLSPVISGKMIRYRSTENILEEIEECINKYNIRNFFFKSDTFTANSQHVRRLCNRIIEKKLDIRWVANSRVKPIDYETLSLMKEAGCWLVGFGIESGNEETLMRIKKGITIEGIINAVQLTKKAGLQIYGFFMFGFPWETDKHVLDTIKFAKRLALDYYEFHLAIFYPGTPLYQEAFNEGLISENSSPIGKNYFTNPSGTRYLSKKELLRYRKKAIISIYFSPVYIIRRLIKVRNFKNLVNMFRYGVIRLIWNMIRP